MHTYLIYKYIFFFIWIKVGSGIFVPAEPEPDSWEKNVGSSSLVMCTYITASRDTRRKLSIFCYKQCCGSGFFEPAPTSCVVGSFLRET